MRHTIQVVPRFLNNSTTGYKDKQFGYIVEVDRDGLITRGQCYLPFNSSREVAQAHALEYVKHNKDCEMIFSSHRIDHEKVKF